MEVGCRLDLGKMGYMYTIQTRRDISRTVEDVELLLSVNMPRRLAQQRMTLIDLE